MIETDTIPNISPGLLKLTFRLYHASKDSARFAAIGAIIAVAGSFIAKDLATAESFIVLGTLSGAIIGGLFGLAHHGK